ncbi:TeTratriCopeptide repeat [Desmophyllum pertusum]|uniref:TeTratriCopeptide repeat n=1 Tax=Desmophyllum pertusum TaxID=174260 RepID=A0A9X0D4D5_9CNID|nr:TeTratriCopeptide repeat [Desmophyllum pertusum]
MRGETLLRLGKDWTSVGEMKKAAEIYQQCAEIFQEMGDKNTQLLILNNLASLLAELRDIANCGKVLTQVIELCVEVDDNALKGKVYNDIGLLYNGLKSYENAAECFELAIPLIRTENPDKKLESVLQQNLGAVYNQLKQYNKAMECHRQAVSLHGELSNRAAQGQAFCNMGFAQSQLGDYNKAGESFTHAVQAAKDSNDKRGLWQAYEGLAAVSFLGKEYNEAVEYYKLALSVLSTAGEVDPEHNIRIVSKLANALECQLVMSKKLNGRLPPLRANSVKSDGTVVDERVGKGKRVGKTRSRQEHHQLIARGIDGDQTPSESEESGLSESSSDEEIRQKETSYAR